MHGLFTSSLGSRNVHLTKPLVSLIALSYDHQNHSKRHKWCHVHYTPPFFGGAWRLQGCILFFAAKRSASVLSMDGCFRLDVKRHFFQATSLGFYTDGSPLRLAKRDRCFGASCVPSTCIHKILFWGALFIFHKGFTKGSASLKTSHLR